CRRFRPLPDSVFGTGGQFLPAERPPDGEPCGVFHQQLGHRRISAAGAERLSSVSQLFRRRGHVLSGARPRYPVDLPAARAFTSAVVSGLPPIPQSPLLTSSTTTQVTGRTFSPSTEPIASVSFRT